MTRRFIEGVELHAEHDGESVPCWYADEDAGLRAAEARARWRSTSPGADCQPILLTDAYIADLEWQSDLDRMSTRRLSAEEEVAHYLDLAYAYRVQERVYASQAVGLVSVLSTQKRPSKEVRRQPSRPFRVQAEQAAAVQAAGAFLAGGPDARMAKLRMSVGFAARAHSALRKGHRPDEARMLTLTYRDGVKWEPNHIRSLMDHVRKWHDRNGVKCRYTWVAELQDGSRRKDGGARGAVHYHVLLWVPQGTPHMPMADKQGWWPHGSTRTEKAEKAASYICSYLKKANSKNFGEFPDGCRLYSVGGLDHSLRRARRWLGLPGFVRGNSSALDDWNRSPKGMGGWIDPHGNHVPSEFQPCTVAGARALVRVHTHSRTIDASGPFLWLTDRTLAISGARS